MKYVNRILALCDHMFWTALDVSMKSESGFPRSTICS